MNLHVAAGRCLYDSELKTVTINQLCKADELKIIFIAFNLLIGADMITSLTPNFNFSSPKLMLITFKLSLENYSASDNPNSNRPTIHSSLRVSAHFLPSSCSQDQPTRRSLRKTYPARWKISFDILRSAWRMELNAQMVSACDKSCE